MRKGSNPPPPPSRSTPPPPPPPPPPFNGKPPRQPLSDEDCDAVTFALNDLAAAVDIYEYGLPTHNEKFREKAREVIRAAHGVKGSRNEGPA